MATSLPAPEAPAVGMPFPRLLDQAVRLARAHFRTIYPAVALPVVPLYALLAVAQNLWLGNMGSLLAGEPDMEQALGMMGMGCGFMLIAALTSLALGLAVNAMTVGATAAAAGRPVDMRSSWRFVVRPPVFGTQILVGLAILGAMIACCIPVLYVAPILALVMPVMVQEDVYGGTAIGRSVSLVTWDPQRRPVGPSFWKVLGVFAAGIVLSIAVSVVLQLPFTIARMVLVTREALEDPARQFSSAWNWLHVPEYVLGTLGTLAVYLFTSFALALLYFDLRARKEAPDLQAAVDAMAAPPPPPAPAASTEPG